MNISIMKINIPPPAAPVDFAANSCANDWGKRARIPTMMINEVPLPNPLSVIFSPNHITNKVPAVRTITVVYQK